MDHQMWLERLYGHGFVSPSVFCVSQKLSIVLSAHVELRLTELDFLGKILYSEKLSK